MTIPKSDGGRRPPGIPTVPEGVVQEAARVALEPIIEADMLPCSYGFRSRRSATPARERLREGFVAGTAGRSSSTLVTSSAAPTAPGSWRSWEHECRTGGLKWIRRWLQVQIERGMGNRAGQRRRRP